MRLVTGRRRLLRKKIYKSPHERARKTFIRENRQFNKPFQKPYHNTEKIFTKRRPKRESVSGFKMSYRYKYYNQEKEAEETEDES